MVTTLGVGGRIWTDRCEPVAARAVTSLATSLGLPEPICLLLALRGHGEAAAARHFLKPKLDHLHDSAQMADMPAAVERISAAIRAGEPILVHGDYDVDGVCSSALLTRVLRRLGARVEAFVPHRVTDGYDLGPAGIRAAKSIGARVIITADCGIVAHAAVDAAKAAGIDVIVTDHHTPGATLPSALAVLNPKRADCGYPEKSLCGAGVAFKLCEALVAEHGADRDDVLYELDLVALATIADVVPLTGENRVFTRIGLRVLAATRNVGLQALLQRAELGDGRRLQAGHVSHVLAPRINAAGRLDAAQLGVRLLLSDRPEEAGELADRLEASNEERRRLDRAILEAAAEMMEREFDPDRDYAVVLASPGWHPGVIGIVASRIVELVHRPTVLIALNEEGGAGRGSARSIPGFHLYEALAACSQHLIRFGGHRQAAGFDIRADAVEAFREAFQAYAATVLSPDHLVPRLPVDMELPLAHADAELYRYLRHFGPFGVGNPEPVFVARGVRSFGAPRVVGGGHLKLTLEQDGARMPAIGFGLGDRVDVRALAGAAFDVAYQLREDVWRGEPRLQARILDIRLARG